MKSYQIWMEGFNVTGDGSSASFLGEFQSDTFLKAVDQAVKEHCLEHVYKIDNGHPYIWGCRVFDNEKDARKNFG